jgi:hypothetical protein
MACGQVGAGVGAFGIVRPGLPGPAPGFPFARSIKAAAARFAKVAAPMMTPGPGGFAARSSHDCARHAAAGAVPSPPFFLD